MGFVTVASLTVAAAATVAVGARSLPPGVTAPATVAGSSASPAAPGHTPGPAPAPAGNLTVSVPLTPPPGIIKKYCDDYLAGRSPAPSRWLSGFAAETGVSVAASTRWCATYEVLARHRPAPGGAGR